MGIDMHAHRAAMESAQAKTVAMLGCGLNRISPARSQHFATQLLARGGALFSEVLPETETASPQLVARNRLTTGMSQATIIVEAGATSGALYAAKFARKQERFLGAVDIVAEGNMELIREGAYLVRHDLSNIEAFVERLS
jgi:DNA processing protein